MRKYISGQSLMEILIAIAFAALLLTGAVSTYIILIRSSANTRITSVGTQLAQETFDNIKFIGENNWHTIFNLIKDSNYYLSSSAGVFTIMPGKETIVINDITYTRSFIVRNVRRDDGGQIIITSGGIDDPSTQLIDVTVSWSIAGSEDHVSVMGYIMRTNNASLQSTDWHGGPGFIDPITGQSINFFNSSNIEHTTPGIIRLMGF